MRINRNIKNIAVFTIALIIGVALVGVVKPADEAFATLSILKTNVENCDVTLSYNTGFYNGKYKKPVPEVVDGDYILVKGKDYTVSYKSNKNPGTAKCIIKGKGSKYKGTKTVTFKIVIGAVNDLTADYNGLYPYSKKSKIVVDWTKPKSKYKYYKVKVTKDGELIGKGTYKVTKSTYTLTGLSGPGMYEFDVKAYGGPKNTASEPRAAIVDIQRALDKPTAKVVSIGYRRMDLEWTQVPGAQGYYVKETDVATGKTETFTVDCEETSMSFYDKVQDRTYKYTVQAFANYDDVEIQSLESNETSAKAAKTYIGQAKTGETGNARGNQAGDQNGREVSTGGWSYSETESSYKHWTYMARFKDPKKAEKCAQLMEQACANDNIGYDQGRNLTMTEIAKSNGYNLAAISTPCDTDCVCLVSVCINGSIGKWTVSGLNPRKTMTSKLKGLPTYLTVSNDPKYLVTDAYLQRGDILWTDTGNHTVIVL